MTAKDNIEVIPSLSNATSVGQLVAGSSPESRYVCVALAPEVAMAVRITSLNKVSVRVERRGSVLLKGALAGKLANILGLKIQSGDIYASSHVSADDATRACMAAAAYIAGFNSLFKASALATFAEIEALPGKGV